MERFQSLTQPEKLLSLSYWRDMTAVDAWRANANHAQAQNKGKSSLFSGYIIHTAEIVRTTSFKENE